MFGEEVSYQTVASYALYIIIACIIILIMLSICRLLAKEKKKRINSMEKNIQLIYDELKEINEKLDRIYNNDSDDFIDK